MENIKRTAIQVSDLTPGMTVEINGNLHTVNANHLTKTPHGIAFKGDASSKTITRVQFIVKTANGIVLR